MTEDWVIRRLHELEDQIKAFDARVKELERQSDYESQIPPVVRIRAVGTWADRMIDQHADLPIPPLSPH